MQKLRRLKWWHIFRFTLECCVGQILEVINDNGDGDGITLGFIVEYLLMKILVIKYGFSLDVSSFTGI